ncbi:iron-containing alcohol dehydrogenase [Emergencia timonensis]|uniref:iron-containing alcohol dehydrogenase n=1 Tax=Emergencia timonensis TaxID=1776384 RepID=UPI0039931634
MQNFNYSIPTKVYFGKGQIKKLSKISQFGTKVLMVYGGGSIKGNGIYDKAAAVLRESDVSFFELSGVDPNPRIETVALGAKLCKEKEIDAVLAIGGGSTIDCAKMIAAAAKYEGDPWDLVLDGSKIKDALPIVTILTLAATGSEMDGFAVISDMDKNDKLDTASELIKPAFSILDPKFTYSVSQKQTAAGTADIMSHVFEVYFTREKDAFLQARMCEAVLKTCIKYGPAAMENPEDYDARANLMWASSLAINGLLSYGSDVQWCVHPMEHELSAFYDITHGVGLAILTPVWMEYVLSEATIDKFVEFGINVWGIDAEREPRQIAEESIDRTRAFFAQLGLPRTLADVGIGEENLSKMADKLDGLFTDTYIPLTGNEVLEIYRRAL